MTRGGERGFALLIVLFTLVLLALLVGAIGAGGRGEAQLADNLRAGAMAEAAADGAVQQAVFHVIDSSAARWPADGTPHRVQLAASTVDVRVATEAGKVNPNTASAALLQALMQVVGADRLTAGAVAAAILDWRSPDAQGDPAGRARAYRAAGRDYGPPAQPLQSIDELGRVLGMTSALLAALRPHLSLYRDRDPDPAAADPEVAAALALVAGASQPAPAATRGSSDATVVCITAAAAGPGRARFVRQAVVRIDPGQQSSPFQVMQWATLPWPVGAP